MLGTILRCISISRIKKFRNIILRDDRDSSSMSTIIDEVDNDTFNIQEFFFYIIEKIKENFGKRKG